RNANDTKGGKRREINARLSFNVACELGFRGSLDEWERLMGSVTKRESLACARNQSGFSSSKQLFRLAPAWDSSLQPLLRNNWGRHLNMKTQNPKHQRGSIRLAATQRGHKGRSLQTTLTT